LPSLSKLRRQLGSNRSSHMVVAVAADTEAAVGAEAVAAVDRAAVVGVEADAAVVIAVVMNRASNHLLFVFIVAPRSSKVAVPSASVHW